ncbi:hypothetical protein N7523_006652 [Penicillium sp. IBT 18751x]|nr:hypothetical protein N7523_006652 [Penicillium sp. IBT 18751x]
MGEMNAKGRRCAEAAKATYGPFYAKLDTLLLAYIEVMRWWATYDPIIDSKPAELCGIPLPTIQSSLQV